MTSVVATKVWKTGRKQLFRIVTRSGRSVRATANHPFRVLGGWKALEELRVEERIAVPLASMLGDSPHAGGSIPARQRTTQETTSDLRELREIDSDLYWDEVEEIMPDGLEDVYDMTVPETHNFVANGIVVHNSIEQDSDMVMFIYRDEVYNPDSDARGEAELIVAKHRNGPTGHIRLAFMNQYTKFASFAKALG
jgi:replicative DNA helicase